MVDVYFWKDGQVHEYVGFTDADSIRKTEFTYCFAVDTKCANNMRYGQYTSSGWKHVPIEVFPKKFRTHLLLLGVV